MIRKTPDQFLTNFKRMVMGWVDEWANNKQILNDSMWMFGVVNVVSGNKADVYINGASAVTPSIPIAPHVGPLAANDQVLVLNRSRMRDLLIISKTSSSFTWQTPSLVNGWVNYGTPDAPAGYFKDSSGVVHVRGMIKGGTSTPGTTLFVLPSGYRPAYTEYFAVASNNGTSDIYGDVVVKGDGSVIIAGAGGNGFVSLSGITFKAEQ